MLYLVATPIGNLLDITLRAIETLKAVDYILCEDTRHTLVLLKHYSISKPLKSYHKFNLAKEEENILEELKQGKKIALVCDAGTPGIADPSHELTIRCQKESIPYTVIPGPCALIAALTLSGFHCDPFQFKGFLPKKAGELKQCLIEILHYPGTTVCYESPHRIIETLKEIEKLSPLLILSIARELTKIYEECLKGTASELLAHFEKNPPKGEIVLLFSKKETAQTSTLTPKEEVELLQQQYGLSLKEAIKLAAQLRNESKKEIYKLFHKEHD